MEVVRERITATGHVAEKNIKCSCECNVIVPDKNPDIIKILHVDATCSLLKRTVTNGRLSFEGKVFANVIYLPDGDGGGVKMLPTVFDFNDILDSSEISEDMCAKLSCDVESLDVNLINSRKISLRATVAVDAELMRDREIEYISTVNSSDAAYKCDEINLYRLLANDECEFRIKDRIDLENGGLTDIIKCDATITDKEFRLAGSKVIVKGVAMVTMLYSDESNSIKNTTARFPFTEVFEVADINETDNIEVCLSVIENECREGRGADSIPYINAEILVRAELYVRRDECISCLCDCYCFGAETKSKEESITVERINTLPPTVQSVREIITADNGAPRISAVYNAVAKSRIVSTEKTGNTVTANGVLEASILYLSDNNENPICCRKAEIPISYSFDITEAGELMISSECEHISYTLTAAGDVEIRAVVTFCVSCRTENNIKIISDIERGEEINSSELVIFFAKGGESVWNIAKEYKADPSVVAELNKLDESMPVEKGRRLIIPTM